MIIGLVLLVAVIAAVAIYIKKRGPNVTIEQETEELLAAAKARGEKFDAETEAYLASEEAKAKTDVAKIETDVKTDAAKVEAEVVSEIKKV